MAENEKHIIPKDHDDWLEIRRTGIGGSDAATIAGLNKYESLYYLYLDKLGKLKPKPENEAMRQGHDLEEYVAQRFTEKTGKTVKKREYVIKNPEYPFALANVDRWIEGENAGLECKTTSSYNWNNQEGEFPENYYIQCLHYMAVTGAEKYYLAVLVFSKGFYVFEFERDEEAIKSLMQLEREFWELVENKTPPDVDGSKSTEEALQQQFNPEDNSIILYDLSHEAKRLNELKKKKKSIEEEIDIIEQQFKQRLGNNTSGQTDKFEISWKPERRTTFQTKLFMNDNPDIDYSPYYKASEKRVFRMKEINNE